MACLYGQRVDKSACSTIVVGLEALKLTRFLTIRTGDSLTGGIAWQTPQATVYGECLQPILRGQELNVQTSLAYQFLGNRLIEPHGYLHCLSLGCHHYPTVEVVVIITHRHLDGAVLTVNLTVSHLGHQVPLLGRIVQTHGTTLYCTHTVVNDLYTRVLLVVEASIETVAEYQHVHTLPLEILAVIQG